MDAGQHQSEDARNAGMKLLELWASEPSGLLRIHRLVRTAAGVFLGTRATTSIRWRSVIEYSLQGIHRLRKFRLWLRASL